MRSFGGISCEFRGSRFWGEWEDLIWDLLRDLYAGLGLACNLDDDVHVAYQKYCRHRYRQDAIRDDAYSSSTAHVSSSTRNAFAESIPSRWS